MSHPHAKSVKEFTEAGRGITCPNTPQKMSLESCKFLIKMVMSEMQELALTNSASKIESIQMLQTCLGEIDVSDISDTLNLPNSDVETIAAQADAMVDAMYYMYDMAAKHGINLDLVFTTVHQANMNKRWPDGTFHRRDDGKIIKPPDWEGPDVVAEIQDQTLALRR